MSASKGDSLDKTTADSADSKEDSLDIMSASEGDPQNILIRQTILEYPALRSIIYPICWLIIASYPKIRLIVECVFAPSANEGDLNIIGSLSSTIQAIVLCTKPHHKPPDKSRHCILPESKRESLARESASERGDIASLLLRHRNPAFRLIVAFYFALPKSERDIPATRRAFASTGPRIAMFYSATDLLLCRTHSASQLIVVCIN